MSGPLPSYEEMSLKAIILVLRRRKWLILAMVLLCTGAAALFAMLQVPRYTAEAMLQFNPRTQPILAEKSVVANLPPDEAALKSELDVMESRDLLQRVNKKLDLAATPEFQLAPNENPDIARTITTDRMLKRLSITHAPQTYTVRVGFTSGSPEMAAKLANTLVDEYLAFRQESKLGIAEGANSWLNERIQELKAKVHASEEAVQKYQEQHNLLRMMGGETVANRQLEEINTQMVDAQMATAQAEARLQQARSLFDKSGNALDLDSIPDVLRSELIQQLKVKATEVQQRLSELSARYGARHPQMIKVHSELVDIEKRIVSEVGKVVKGLEHELEVARIKQASLEKSLKRLKGEMAEGTRFEVQLAELQRDKETNITLYNEFLSRYKETSNGTEQSLHDAQVISYAPIPLSPSWPKKKLILVAGFVSGMFIGLALAFVLENLDKGFRNVSQLEKVTGATALGMVPDIIGSKYKVTDYVLHRPTSVYAEALRTVMTGVRFSNPDNQPKVMMVASSIPEEGKSMFSVSMARMTAKSGSKVLLVDCDMRVPTTHNAFGAQPELCLENIIMDGKSIAEVVGVDAETGLHFIRTSGKVTHSQQMLGSDKMKEFIAAARAQYDLVILDSPPLMALADGVVLARMADATVLLARWESTPREVTVAALKALKGAQAKVAGVVLNRVNIKKFERYHYNDAGVEYGKYHQYYSN